MILAHRMVCQPSKSDLMRLASRVLICRGSPEIEFEIGKKVDKNSLFFVNPAISNAMRLAPSGQILTFDPPFDAPGS